MDRRKERIYYDLNFIKQEELKILILFDRICKKNKLQYSLAGGTLLGAVRHQGFIPWDDDVDVLMPRDDFEEFCGLFNTNFDQKYFLQTFHTDPLYLNNFAKIINLEIPAFIAETEKLDIKKGVCVDVFPIDKVTENALFRLLYISRMSLYSILKYSTLEQTSTFRIQRICRRILKIITQQIGVQKINQWENAIRTKYNSTASKITYADFVKSPYKLTPKDIYPYSLFESFSELEFEGYYFSVVKDFHGYLSIAFGDYMELPPENERVPGHNFYHY